MKKIVIMFLAIVGIMHVSAQIATPPLYGDGTKENPYQIATLENLYWIAADTLNYDKHYIQTAHIDASETRNWFIGDHDNDPGTPDEPMGWKPIGGYSPEESRGVFAGKYDGTGHSITDLFINYDNNESVGLFGRCSGAELINISVLNADIKGGVAGVLCGSFNGTIYNCHSSGKLSAGFAGGLVGEGSGIIEKSSANIILEGHLYAGGLIGHLYAGEIRQSFSSGSVTCLAENTWGAGGFAGGCEGSIANCFSISDVISIYPESSASGFVGGGFLGSCEILNSFSAGRITAVLRTGFAGPAADATNCFWDSEASGAVNSESGTGLTTDEMKNIMTFLDAGWDFAGETNNGIGDIWEIDGITNRGYPFLKWMTHPIAVAPESGDGTRESPYKIATLENLYWIAADTLNYDKHYIQTAHIDASETRNWFIGDHDIDPGTPDEPMGWKPIGSQKNPFTGSLNGYSISGLYINRPSDDNIGLFGIMENAFLGEISLINFEVRGRDNTGAVAGSLVNSEIYKVWVKATCSVIGSYNTGGITGFSSGSIISLSYVSGSVSGDGFTGGITGINAGGSVIEKTTSFGSVYGNSHTGGIAGLNSNSAVINCNNRSPVYGGDYVGGLIGKHESGGTVIYTYSAGLVNGSANTGGLIGYLHDAEVSSSFWDVGVSGVEISSGGTGKTSSEMQTFETYFDAGWDFAGESVNGTENIWILGDGSSYYPWIQYSASGLNDSEPLPDRISLFQNYPNPFNPVTKIFFSVPSYQEVRIAVFNSNGQLVTELIRARLSKGSHSVIFDGKNLNSGVYFYVLETGNSRISRKMILLK